MCVEMCSILFTDSSLQVYFSSIYSISDIYCKMSYAVYVPHFWPFAVLDVCQLLIHGVSCNTEIKLFAAVTNILDGNL